METKKILLGFCVLSMVCATISADGNVVRAWRVDLGASLKISWEVPHFSRLAKVQMFINNTMAILSYSSNFPGIGCIKNPEGNEISFDNKKRIFDICSRKIEPYSSIKNRQFHLVITNITDFFNGSTLTAVFDYKFDQNHSSTHTDYVKVIVDKPTTPASASPPSKHVIHSTDTAHPKHSPEPTTSTRKTTPELKGHPKQSQSDKPTTPASASPPSKHVIHSTDTAHPKHSPEPTTSIRKTTPELKGHPKQSQSDATATVGWVLLAVVVFFLIIIALFVYIKSCVKIAPSTRGDRTMQVSTELCNIPSTRDDVMSGPVREFSTYAKEALKNCGSKVEEIVIQSQPLFRRIRRATCN